MAYGKVGTGFSLPWVAKYTASDGVVTYSDARRLARGVSVKISPEVSDTENFYADNIEAEEESGTFTGGELTLEVDGLLQDAEQFVFGTAKADDDGFIAYNSSQSAPYVGVGFVRRYKSGGVVYYTPIIICKTKFIPGEDEAETAEDSANWQTQELTATIFRDDTDDRAWKLIGTDYTSESEAEEKIKSKFNYSETTDEEE